MLHGELFYADWSHIDLEGCYFGVRHIDNETDHSKNDQMNVCILFWEIVGFETIGPYPSQTNGLKMYTRHFQARRLTFIRVVQELVGSVSGLMWLSGISGYGAGGLVSQSGNTIKSSWLCTVTSGVVLGRRITTNKHKPVHGVGR